MSRELLGLGVIVILLLTAASHWRGTPDKGNYTAATNALPRFHLYKSPADADQSIDLVDTAGHRAGRLVLDDGRVYEPKDQSVRAVVTSDLYLVDTTRWDVGAFGGYRDSANPDTADFAVGLRLSPARLLYGTVAPDLVLAKDWAGAGVSAYLPEELVGRLASHIGIGAWYGVPFHGGDSSGAAWCYGLSFSTH